MNKNKYGFYFRQATEEEVERLLDLADNAKQAHNWTWLVKWVTQGSETDRIHDPRTDKSPMPATADRVLAHFLHHERKKAR